MNEHSTNRAWSPASDAFARSVGRAVAILFAFNSLYFTVFYLEAAGVDRQVAAPDAARLLAAYEGAVRNFADVEWHIGLVENGYDSVDTSGTAPPFWKQQRNWAFFPLSPVVGRALAVPVGSSFWALWWMAQLGLGALLVVLDVWLRSRLEGTDQRTLAWLALLFFALPPIAFATNFIVLPMFLFATAVVFLGRWLHERERARNSLGIALVACFLAGLSRPQGLALNAAVLVLLAANHFWFRRRMPGRELAALVASNVLPVLLIFLLYDYYANDLLAFQKIQSAWGRSLSAPWTPFVNYVRSGLVMNLFHDDLLFNALRFAFFAFFVLGAAADLLARGGAARSIRDRDYRGEVFQLWICVVSLGFLLLPLMSDSLLAAHRYMSFAFLAVPVWLGLGKRLSLLMLTALILIRLGEMALFFRGVRAFIW